MRQGIRIAFVALVFGAGYLLGALGAAAELGTTITGMQENVSELQKHIDTLNKIKGALGGS
jgi:hypothetical protein